MFSKGSSLKIILLITIFSITSYSFGIIESFILMKKGKKEVCLLGDFHASAFPEDIRDQELIFAKLDKLAKHQHSIAIHLEMNEPLLKKLKQAKNMGGVLGLYENFPIYAQEQAHLMKNLKFKLTDIRQGVLRSVPVFFEIANIYTLPSYLSLYINKDAYKATLGTFSLHDFFNEVTKQLKEAHTFIQNKEQPQATRSFIKKLKERVEKYKKSALQTLTGYNLEEPFIDTFTLYAKDHSLKALLEDHMYTWLQPLGDSLADIGFTKALSEDLSKYNQILVFGGHNHIMTMRSYLKECSYQTVSEKGLLEQTNGPIAYKGSRFTKSELSSLLDSLFSVRMPSKKKQ
jgi:hypothetical protein